MSCQHLVCAYCSGPVSEGRCSLCRASRQQVHHQYGGQTTVLVLALAVVLLLAIAAVAERLAG